MSDSVEVQMAVTCLCCNRFYMRAIKFKDVPFDAEACPTCARKVIDVLRDARALNLDTWFTLNRLRPYD